MKKKHYVFLGKAGLIYYSWMFVVLFISLTFFYEKNTTISWPGVSLLIGFFVILIYTILTSYWNKEYFRIPFKFKVKIPQTPKLIKRIWKFNFYEIKLNKYQTFYLVRFIKISQK
ncbi:acyltransferase [Lactobacillus sp. LL6]|nr:acyltransferase [Lactobacillus sp. LL6]